MFVRRKLVGQWQRHRVAYASLGLKGCLGAAAILDLDSHYVVPDAQNADLQHSMAAPGPHLEFSHNFKFS